MSNYKETETIQVILLQKLLSNLLRSSTSNQNLSSGCDSKSKGYKTSG